MAMKDRALKDLTNSPSSSQERRTGPKGVDIAECSSKSGLVDGLDKGTSTGLQTENLDQEQQIVNFVRQAFNSQKRSRQRVKELEAENKRLRSSLDLYQIESTGQVAQTVKHEEGEGTPGPSNSVDNIDKILAKSQRDDLVKRKLRDKVIELRKLNETLQKELASLQQIKEAAPSDMKKVKSEGDMTQMIECQNEVTLKIKRSFPSPERKYESPSAQAESRRLTMTGSTSMRDLVGSTKSKAMRQQMSGQDCPCCVEYYAANPPPNGVQGPRWGTSVDSKLSPRPGCVRSGKYPQRPAERSAIEEHQDRISRHRVWIPDPETPPDYWNMEMPDTQRVIEINKEALAQSARRDARNKRYGF